MERDVAATLPISGRCGGEFPEVMNESILR
jgi:hypothetical protein